MNDTRLFSENVLVGVPENWPLDIKSQSISTGKSLVEYPSPLV